MAEIICPKLTINGVETTEYQGHTIKQINYNGNTYVLQTAPAVEPYLTFSSPDTFSLKTDNATSNWDGALEYSLNKTTWNLWDGSEIFSAKDGLNDCIYLRGTGNTHINTSFVGQSGRWVLTGSNISCTGNIENLLDYATVSAGNHPNMATDCYSNMFRGCTSLVSAPELPATTLSNSCYSYMFGGCTSLTTAPELPAKTLANNCYSSMFYGCENLTTAPELQAIILATGCYSSMFNGCESLVSAPALPATGVVQTCYNSMFRNCKNLVSIPELPATYLARSCYPNMFYGCSKIKLSTTQTGEYQTAYRIPISGHGTAETNALSNMFTSTGGSFTGTPSINTTYYTSNTVIPAN